MLLSFMCACNLWCKKKKKQGQKQIQVSQEKGAQEEITQQLQVKVKGRRKEQEQNDAFETGLHQVKTIKACTFQLCAAAHAHVSRTST